MRRVLPTLALLACMHTPQAFLVHPRPVIQRGRGVARGMVHHVAISPQNDASPSTRQPVQSSGGPSCWLADITDMIQRSNLTITPYSPVEMWLRGIPDGVPALYFDKVNDMVRRVWSVTRVRILPSLHTHTHTCEMLAVCYHCLYLSVHPQVSLSFFDYQGRLDTVRWPWKAFDWTTILHRKIFCTSETTVGHRHDAAAVQPPLPFISRKRPGAVMGKSVLVC